MLMGDEKILPHGFSWILIWKAYDAQLTGVRERNEQY